MSPPVCPICGSERVEAIIYSRARSADSYVISNDVAIGLPLAPIDETSPNWRCADCSHEWPDPDRIQSCRELREFFDRQTDPGTTLAT